MERAPNKSQQAKYSGEGNSPAAPAGIRTHILSVTSPMVSLQAVPAVTVHVILSSLLVLTLSVHCITLELFGWAYPTQY